MSARGSKLTCTSTTVLRPAPCRNAGWYATTMNSPFSWHWDYDRGETLADAVIHLSASLSRWRRCSADRQPCAPATRAVTAVSIYLAGLLSMVGFSAAYNLWPVSPFKWWLRRLDHSAIIC